MAFLSLYLENNMRYLAGENPPITRNRLPRNGFDIYICRTLERLEKENLSSIKKELYNYQQRCT